MRKMFIESGIQKSLSCRKSIFQWRTVLKRMLKSLKYTWWILMWQFSIGLINNGIFINKCWSHTNRCQTFHYFGKNVLPDLIPTNYLRRTLNLRKVSAWYIIQKKCEKLDGQSDCAEDVGWASKLGDEGKRLLLYMR